jgi:hypothetical protein
MKYYIRVFFKNPSRKFKFHCNRRTLHEDICVFATISHSVLLGMRNISDKIVEKIKICILCSVSPPQKKIVPSKELMWKNMVEPERTQMTI